MLGKFQKLWLQHQLRVSQYNLEYYRFWVKRLGADKSLSQVRISNPC